MLSASLRKSINSLTGSFRSLRSRIPVMPLIFSDLTSPAIFSTTESRDS